MPAKAKYLSKPWSRASRVAAAILGSYVVTMLIHVAMIEIATADGPFLLTSSYSSFLCWVGLMILSFFIRKVWHVWTLFSLVSAVCLSLIYI